MIVMSEEYLLSLESVEENCCVDAELKWDQVYTAFLEGVREVIKLSGGKEFVKFEVYENDINRIWPTFKSQSRSIIP